MGEDTDTGRIIVFVIIAIVYGISAVVKKFRRWSEENKARQRQMRLPEEITDRMPTQVPRESPQDLPGSLLGELERKLRDFQEGLPRQETQQPREARLPSPNSFPQTQASPQAQPQRQSQPQPQPQRAATQRQRIGAGSRMVSRPAIPSVSPAMQRSIIAGREVAAVRHRHLGHLAVLRDSEDIRRGIVLNEILSPPLASRRGIVPTFRRI
jgi:hypothetical protein